MEAQTSNDPYLWLEDIDGARALDWVRARNAECMDRLAETVEFESMRGQVLGSLDDDARIPHVIHQGDFYYNFWRDASHPRGLWRRTTLASFRADQPVWEVLLDVDALAEAEKENWVWQEANCREPDYRRCLISLSRGGTDAHVVREFDLEVRAFVPDGFRLEQAKSFCSWKDADTLYVATDFGPGSISHSGYPRVAKLWRRGQSLAEATTVYAGFEDDMMVFAFHDPFPGYARDFVLRQVDFYASELYLLDKEGRRSLLEVPRHAEIMIHGPWLLVRPREPWQVGERTYSSGTLLAANLDDWVAGKHAPVALFEPSESTALSGYFCTRSCVILQILEDVKSRIDVLSPRRDGWQRDALEGLPEATSVTYVTTTAHEHDEILILASGFLEPDTLYRGIAGQPGLETLKRGPTAFDSSRYAVEQHFVASADGTRVPYFLVSAKDLPRDGCAPTLMMGYGGFETSMLPFYLRYEGPFWLERGGVYILANIRGGGEYGPRWHQAALREKRSCAFEDFAAVAQDLVARGITCAQRLGIEGGSNGGLLVGNMLTRWPELFGAIVCAVPLLDMRRYTKLLAGASWIAEYGDPDQPKDWEFLRAISPYHNLHPQIRYPSVLFLTSTSDDRVHPGHARKMAAKMLAMGKDVLYYEHLDGGHSAAAGHVQVAFNQALMRAFLWETLL
ncbi:prolyl oligopeptidase family serine peptidase [Cupriavidus necator]